MKAKSTAIVLISFLFITGKSHAQFYKDMSVGLNGGIYIYQGDLTPQTLGSIKTIQPGFSFLQKPINHFLAARVHFSFARLKAMTAATANQNTGSSVIFILPRL